jgi:ankyrin repeat protein
MPATQTQLFDAVKAGRLEEVESLLETSPGLLAARVPGGPSAILLAVYYRHPEVAEAFVRRGTALDIFDASALGRTDRMRELLREDPKLVDAWSEDGFFPLGLAAFFGHPETVRLLLARGADVAQVARNAMRIQAIHAAVAGRSRETVELVVEAGAPINAQQDKGWTALHEVVNKKDLDLTRYFLAHGADPKVQNDEGKSPIGLAAEQGSAAILKVLKGQG